MKTTILIRRNLTWFRRTNLAVVLGVATAVAVLTGALMVGDSVRRSLRDLVIGRLGRTDLVVTASNLFREQLIDDLKSSPQFAATFADGVSLLVLPGVTSRDETGARAGDVQVYGVYQRFWDFHGLKVAEPGRSEGLISPGLAAELGVNPGEMLAVRIETPAAIPVESIHGRRDETGQTIRFTVREVLPSRSLGEFSLHPRQGEVRAIFLPLARLQRYIDQAGPTGPNELNGQGGRVNVMLLAARPGSAAATEVAAALLRDQVTLDDLAIRLRPIDREAAPGVLSVETTSAIISDSLAQSIEQTAT
ncbi:MAG: ABC transporter permease, partial [Acidobacteriota bacterium]